MNLDFWKATFVRRWHTNTDFNHLQDDTGGHSARVALLALKFKPNLSREALLIALTHDLGELYTGDMARPFKENNPEMARVFNIVEAQSISEMGFRHEPITNQEAELINFCDKLDSFLWAMKHKPDMIEVDDWRDFERSLRIKAAKLNIEVQTVRMMEQVL